MTFEPIKAVKMFCAVTPRELVDICGSFGKKAYCFHLQGLGGI
jgi:hypothetical protein